jgi:hypothetical protein
MLTRLLQLNQSHQLSIAKTCAHFWELYPWRTIASLLKPVRLSQISSPQTSLLTLDSLTHPAYTASMMSTKNTILLLDTQQQLTRANLPGIRGSSSIRITDYLSKSLQFPQLRDVAFQLFNRDTREDMHSFIVQKSPNLNNIHLRLCSQGQ